MQHAQDRFRARGIGLAAISYDSAAILREFAARQNISYPLLSDPDSALIRKFGVLNQTATGLTAGMAHPGYFFIAPSGVVREKFFETNYADRYTANNVISRLFPELVENASDFVSLPHLQVRTFQSDQTAGPGSRVTLGVEIKLPPHLHVYAPGVKGYKAIALVLDGNTMVDARDALYPAPKILWLAAIKERVPVFEGTFRIQQDVIISKDEKPPGGKISLQGKLKYQACDDKICFVPAEAPLQWQLEVKPLDMTRSPDAIRHKK